MEKALAISEESYGKEAIDLEKPLLRLGNAYKNLA